ncbi:hypothetical protein GGR97_001919 [Wenyingzhuangia aestuarii]|nr:hypothetical protein [Wenyingzhuangia aestuarii]
MCFMFGTGDKNINFWIILMSVILKISSFIHKKDSYEIYK